MSEPIPSESGLLPLATIVVPIYNEELGIEPLFTRLATVIKTLPKYRWEMILVDDGSSDQSVPTIKKLKHIFPGNIRLIEFSRNFGHQPALLAGLHESTGDLTIIIDADLQDPPELFTTLIAQYEQGFDVVYAIRETREEGVFKRVAYGMFYRIMDFLTEVQMPLDAGDFGLVSKRVVTYMISHPDKDLFLRGMRSWIGFKQTGIKYDRPQRFAGETKYTLSKLFKLAGSGIFGYSSLPLRFSTMMGMFSLILCGLYVLYAIMGKLIYNYNPPGWTSLIVVITFLGAVQLMSIGVLGEYISRIYKQVQPRPHFIVKDSKVI